MKRSAPIVGWIRADWTSAPAYWPSMWADCDGGPHLEVTGYTLEYSDQLPAISWTAVSGGVSNQVTVDASAGNRFFRLRK